MPVLIPAVVCHPILTLNPPELASVYRFKGMASKKTAPTSHTRHKCGPQATSTSDLLSTDSGCSLDTLPSVSIIHRTQECAIIMITVLI